MAKVTYEEAKRILKENNNRIQNADVNSFISLKEINKIYPNGVQAVYDFNIDIKEHDFIVLVGPSGCGKSTTLRMVAGLEDITSGYLYIDKVLSNYLASKDRDISMVFQSYALYPQMTVYDNIAFPLRNKKYEKVLISKVLKACDEILGLIDNINDINVAIEESKNKKINYTTKNGFIAKKLGISEYSAKILVSLKLDENNKDSVIAKLTDLKNKEYDNIKNKGYTLGEGYALLKDGEAVKVKQKLTQEEIREKVFEAARILDLGDYLDRFPKELSGGQMQRVALGRAIVRHAKLFLMDEPLSNLDAKLRVQMRSEIVRIHNQVGATTIYVTHDQTEAMTMATKIAVMSKGWVQQIGEPQVIYNRPKNLFVATFIGSPAMNIVDAEYENGVASFKDGYSIKLNREFKKVHDEFYAQKIAELNRMLASTSFKKMKALKVIDNLIENEALSLDDTSVNEVVSEVFDLNEVASFKDNRKKYLSTIRKSLLDFEEIPTNDIHLLHNAQMYDESSEINDANKNGTKNINLHSTDVKFVNNLYDVATSLLSKCENALKGRHPIKVGIRPEDIHLSKEYKNKNRTNKLTLDTNIVELMGSELLVHTEWNGKEVIAKITSNTFVKPNTTVDFTFNGDKVLVFDSFIGDTILMPEIIKEESKNED